MRLLLILALAVPAIAERIVYTSPRLADCADGCKDAVTALTFGDKDPEADYYAGLLASSYTLASVVACMGKYCTREQSEASWATWVHYFAEEGLTLEPLLTYAPKNGTDWMPVVNVLDPEVVKATWNTSVMVDAASATAGWKTEKEWDMQMIYHHAYGWAMYLLLGVMLVIGLINRAWTAYMYSRPLRHDAEAHAPRAASGGALSRPYTWYRAHIGVPATFGYRHLQPWGMLSIPTRIQAILVFIYVALNFIWSCTNYNLFDDNLYWPGHKDQLVRYIADRTGIMSFYNLPLLWLLAGRNDVFMWLTGFSYPSCNLFHKWVARIATLQAIAHSAAYTWLERGYLATEFKARYWATGVFATVVMSLMIPLSIRPLREKAYEVFLLLHIALALATLVLLFYHVEIFGTDYNGYLWACVAVWLFDRVLRVVRIAFLSRKGNTVARITHDSPTGLIRLSVTTPRMFRPAPGAYYFLYTPRSIKPWENHPFTLASWHPSGKGYELNFLAKAHDGATRALRERVAAHANGLTSAPMTVLLEGPYGARHHLEGFDRVLLISGGSGITALLPYIFELSRSEHAIKSIRVVWAVRESSYAADVLAHELARDNVGAASVEIYVSQQEDDAAAEEKERIEKARGPATVVEGAEAAPHNSSSELSTRASDDVPESNVKAGRYPIIRFGRPSASGLVAQEIAALVGDQRLAVLACGPWSMMDDLRLAVADSYGSGQGQVSGSRLEYFEEAFGW